MDRAHFSVRLEPIFALIVGIDQYQANDEFNTLNGAVNDAESFKNHLADFRESF
ncbi:hypothetical protein FB451DRAFT_1403068 [Mycena latifolia]|nr:hypothetical protein FB451DRAFT_1403068 [Mycena latifolia]